MNILENTGSGGIGKKYQWGEILTQISVNLDTFEPLQVKIGGNFSYFLPAEDFFWQNIHIWDVLTYAILSVSSHFIG